MKATRILVSSLLLVVAASSANAQQARLSWGTCDPQVADLTYSGPNVYKLVVSATGLSQPLIGTDSNIRILSGNNPFPDAWRFDGSGCQANAGGSVTFAFNALNAGCPAEATLALNPLTITAFTYDPVTNTANMRLTITHDERTPVPTTRYTLWQISFDHTFSAAGTDGDPNTCDNGAAGLLFDAFSGTINILNSDGSSVPAQRTPGDHDLTVNGGPPVPAEASTWGRVKGIFR